MKGTTSKTKKTMTFVSMRMDPYLWPSFNKLTLSRTSSQPTLIRLDRRQSTHTKLNSTRRAAHRASRQLRQGRSMKLAMIWSATPLIEMSRRSCQQKCSNMALLRLMIARCSMLLTPMLPRVWQEKPLTCARTQVICTRLHKGTTKHSP